MKKLLFCVTLLLAGATLLAAPVKEMPVKRLQPNGDTLSCLVTGDEFYHRLHDAEGYTIVQNVETGEYVYAASVAADGTLVPSAYRAGSVNPATVGLKPGLMPPAWKLAEMHKRWEVPAPKAGEAPAAKTQPTSFSQLNNIVIFVRFSNETTFSTTSFSTINQMFNDSTPGVNSMYNYFKHSSYGYLTLPTYFYPTPSGNTVLSYQDSLPRNYYEPYSATNTIGYADDDERRTREFGLLERAVNWVNANSPVPSSVNLDYDNDQRVDNICFVVSGTYTGWSELLWPHKWSLYDRQVYMNGKRVYTFNLQLAGSGDHYFSVSTFCHEMTHTLGAPDLYHYSEYSSVSPAGSWDLMCSNGTPPQQTNSVFKLIYTGWFDSIPEIREDGTYTLQSLSTGVNRAYKIASAVRHQWYILEYRNNNDTFDNCIPNRGLLVWRYNDQAPGNADFDFVDNAHELWLFRPGSSIDTVNGTPSQAAFGIGGRQTFNRYSNPHPYLCDGTLDTTIELTNITIASNGQSVTFTYHNNGNAVCDTVTSFPLVQDFESGDEGCWQAVSANSSNASRMGCVNTTDAVHSGNYAFALSSYASATDYNQFLISPRLQPENPLHLTFYYKRSHSSAEDFRVAYSTTTDDTAAFTHTIASYSVTTAGWHLCDLLVPADARYVAIDYYSDYKYYLYVDDIRLADTLRPERDTVYVMVHDTLTQVVYDTIVEQATDTLYYTVVDTLERWTFDTQLVQYDHYQLTVVADNEAQGFTSGSGLFREGQVVEILAMPRKGYDFDHWDDGAVDNPRTMQMSGNRSYRAFFTASDTPATKDAVIHDTIYIHDTVWVVVHQTVHIYHMDTLWMPYDQHDTVWMDMHGIYYLDTTVYYTLQVLPSYTQHGVVAGNGTFPRGTEVQLGATGLAGYRFARWSDNDTVLPRTVVVDGDLELTAHFEPDELAAVTPEALPFTVYARNRQIVVETDGTQPVTVYNVLGEKVYQNNAGQTQTVTPALTAGVYVVCHRQSAVKVVICQ